MPMFQTETWSVLDESGNSAVSFSSFIDVEINAEGTALSYPIEQGSFATYNKVQSPSEITVTLATEGDDADFEDILNQLDEYKEEAVLLSVVTPSMLYESMTLESYSYKREYQNGAGLLTVKLDLVEVRQVESQTTTVAVTAPTSSDASASSSSTASKAITEAKNPSSEQTKDTGKTQTKQSAMFQQTGKISFGSGG